MSVRPTPRPTLPPTPLQVVSLALIELLDAAREHLDPRGLAMFHDIAARRLAREIARATRWEERLS